MFDLAVSDYVGLLGVGITLLAYLLLQMSYLKIEGLTYSVLNAVGAVLILVSLHFVWNSASVAIEVCWFFISIYGIGKALGQRKRQRVPTR